MSFVSVTQAFNATTSMGRLTLNVLLSFAQFEREVTGERIRDKIAMSKAKGLWMGGVVPLGYDERDRALHLNPAEADTVCAIYRCYLDLKSVARLRDELERTGVRSKRWTTRAGEERGGLAFSRGALFHLLANRPYLGEIVHKEKTYPGRHLAIVDAELFARMQAALKAGAAVRRRRCDPSRPSAPLTGRLFDAAGAPMTPNHAYGRAGRAYRYYVSTGLVTGAKVEALPSNAIRRVSAPALEGVLVQELARLLRRPTLQPYELASLLTWVELLTGDTQLVMTAIAAFGADHPDLAFQDLTRQLAPSERLVWETGRQSLRLSLALRACLRGGATRFQGADGQTLASASTPPRDGAFGKLLRSAHKLQHELNALPLSSSEALLQAQGPPASYHRRLGRLAFLAPDLQRALLAGDHPAALTYERLMDESLPLAWTDQRAWMRAVRS